MHVTSHSITRRCVGVNLAGRARRTALPLLLTPAIMLLIFASSAQPKHALPPDADAVYLSGAMPVFTQNHWETLLKKSAHVLIYAALTLALHHALATHPTTRRLGWLDRGGWATSLALLYALSDELHQSFVPGRHASGLDIVLDTAGIALGALAYLALARLRCAARARRM